MITIWQGLKTAERFLVIEIIYQSKVLYIFIYLFSIILSYEQIVLLHLHIFYITHTKPEQKIGELQIDVDSQYKIQLFIWK
jgi:hypothetical protein